MILNEFRYTKENLANLVKRLKEQYKEGWQTFGLAVTYDKRLLLTDGVFITEGYIQIGYPEFQKAVTELQSEDVRKLTDYFHHKITRHTGVLFRKYVIKELKEIAQDEEYHLDYAVVNETKVPTMEQAIKGYHPDKDLELYYRGNIKEYIKNSIIEDENDYDTSEYTESKLMLVVRYRGNSVVIQGWINGVLKMQETYHVNSNGMYEEVIYLAYSDIRRKDRELELEKLKIK